MTNAVACQPLLGFTSVSTPKKLPYPPPLVLLLACPKSQLGLPKKRKPLLYVTPFPPPQHTHTRAHKARQCVCVAHLLSRGPQ